MTAYQPLLTAIKKEYEETVETIKKAQREATFLHGKLKAMASEPSTLRNYRRRSDELEERWEVVLLSVYGNNFFIRIGDVTFIVSFIFQAHNSHAQVLL